MRIIFFGDSLTQGTYGVNFVQKVAVVLPGHDLINAGVDGDTSFNLYRRVQTDVIERTPDGVFMMVGINDAMSWTEPGMRLYYQLIKGVRGGRISPIFFRENMRAVLTRLLHAKIKVWVALPPSEFSPEQVEVLKQMNAFTRELCTEMNVPVLDIMAKLTPQQLSGRAPIGFKDYWRYTTVRVLGQQNYDRMRAEGSFTYTFDGVHLTDSGAQQIAELVAPFLRANGL
jgi:lysophospholipase L1-like esterase